ncbi:hypothetical protein KCP77_12825 [Salmonella enterica subsp. enterica]|nr:hypothetical protein KCP77_12825 [Salmonella enterica subsp. enterica]
MILRCASSPLGRQSRFYPVNSASRNTSQIVPLGYRIRKARTSPCQTAPPVFLRPVSPGFRASVAVVLPSFLPLRSAFPVGIFISSR